MPIKIIPKHEEEAPDHQYRRVVRPHLPQAVEVQSEDGAYCPACGKAQQLAKLALSSLNQCPHCMFWFLYYRLVTITYCTNGTIAKGKEVPK